MLVRGGVIKADSPRTSFLAQGTWKALWGYAAVRAGTHERTPSRPSIVL